MGGESPASVLFSSDGTELAVVSGSSVPASTRALLISGVTPAGLATYVPTASSGALGFANMSDGYVVRSNATITTSGSALVTGNWFGTQQINLVVNITASPTGTTPTITFTIQEVDPGNATTVYGQSASTTALNSIGVTSIFISGTTSPMVQVSWTVTGAGASFTGLYATLTTRVTPGTQTVTGTVTATNSSVGTDGAAALGFDTQIGGKVTTAAPAYTTGNLNALSLTTLGGLRIDGVYAAGTTNATAADVNVSGGYVTTAAPTYTTGQLNPLSLDTAGNLRTSVNNTVTVTGAAASTFNNQSVGTEGAAALGFDTQVGGKVTTAAPTYTTGNLDALSLNTAGGLRIDGVSATATTTGSTAMLSGGAVTTAAPTYTTGQMDPLSLTTLGGLRIDGVYAQGTTNATAADVNVSGGYVTTTAPTYTTGQLNPLSLDTSGNLRVTGFVVTNKAATSAVTTVAAAITSTSILAANTNRIFASIYNNTSQNMFILLNSGAASTSNFSILIMAKTYWEVPNDYVGAINAVWGNTGGNALVTEMTP